MNEEIENIPKGLEINSILKDFEEKSKIEQAQKVIEIQKITDIPKMTQFVMKVFGVEQNIAEYILLAITVLMFIASFYFFFLN